MASVATAGQPTPLVSGKPFCDSGVGEEELRAPFTPKSWMDFFFNIPFVLLIYLCSQELLEGRVWWEKANCELS